MSTLKCVGLHVTTSIRSVITDEDPEKLHIMDQISLSAFTSIIAFAVFPKLHLTHPLQDNRQCKHALAFFAFYILKFVVNFHKEIKQILDWLNLHVLH